MPSTHLCLFQSPFPEARSDLKFDLALSVSLPPVQFMQRGKPEIAMSVSRMAVRGSLLIRMEFSFKGCGYSKPDCQIQDE